MSPVAEVTGVLLDQLKRLAVQRLSKGRSSRLPRMEGWQSSLRRWPSRVGSSFLPTLFLVLKDHKTQPFHSPGKWNQHMKKWSLTTCSWQLNSPHWDQDWAPHWHCHGWCCLRWCLVCWRCSWSKPWDGRCLSPPLSLKFCLSNK